MEKKALILGKGVSGKAAKNLLEKLNYQVKLWDENDPIFPLDNYDLIIKSPGIAPNKPYLKQLGKKTISELDLGILNSKGYRIGITGTNGKSTTTYLTYLLFENLKKYIPFKVFIGGNFGEPFSNFALSTDNSSISILELSSFQLFDSKYLNFDVGAILNIKEDHISWHRTFSNYMFSKLKLILNSKIKIMEEKTYLKYKLAFKKLINSLNIILFGKSKTLNYRLENNLLITPNIKLNLKNYPKFEALPFALDLLASLCIFENFVLNILKIELNNYYNLNFIEEVLEKYTNLPYRLEKRNINGIIIFNDSKSTNPHSVENAIKSIYNLYGKTILILGGKDKGLCFTTLIPLFKKKIEKILLFGEAKINIYKQLQSLEHVEICSSLEEAVQKAIKLAREKNLPILFSPGCSSFDQFKNYLERGEYFDNLLEKYKTILEEVPWIK